MSGEEDESIAPNDCDCEVVLLVEGKAKRGNEDDAMGDGKNEEEKDVEDGHDKAVESGRKDEDDAVDEGRTVEKRVRKREDDDDDDEIKDDETEEEAACAGVWTRTETGDVVKEDIDSRSFECEESDEQQQKEEEH